MNRSNTASFFSTVKFGSQNSNIARISNRFKRPLKNTDNMESCSSKEASGKRRTAETKSSCRKRNNEDKDTDIEDAFSQGEPLPVARVSNRFKRPLKNTDKNNDSCLSNEASANIDLERTVSPSRSRNSSSEDCESDIEDEPLPDSRLPSIAADNEQQCLNDSQNSIRSDISDESLVSLSRSYTQLADNVEKIIENVASFQEASRAMMGEIMKEINDLKSSMKEKKKDIVVPKELSRSIIRLYNLLPDDEKWDLSERFTSETNQQITNQFVEDISVQLKDFSEQMQYEACKKYFYNCRKEYQSQVNNSERYEEQQMQKKMRSRQVRLYKRRTPYVKGAEEQRIWEGASQALMSDEEDGDGCLKVKSPVWRAEELTTLIRKLDERHKKKLLKQDKRVPMTPRVISNSPMKRKKNEK